MGSEERTRILQRQQSRRETKMTKEQFLKLKEEHYQETMVSSFHKDTPAYQEIIDAGKESIPFIMEDWKNSEDSQTFHWFQALYEITGENPIPVTDRGRIVKMKNHWINWYEND